MVYTKCDNLLIKICHIMISAGVGESLSQNEAVSSSQGEQHRIEAKSI